MIKILLQEYHRMHMHIKFLDLFLYNAIHILLNIKKPQTRTICFVS